eukprot:5278628-Pleurochrysis_carterae.AAC.1
MYFPTRVGAHPPLSTSRGRDVCACALRGLGGQLGGWTRCSTPSRDAGRLRLAVSPRSPSPLACRTGIAMGDGGWGEHLGRVRARWRRHRARVRSRVRNCVPSAVLGAPVPVRISREEGVAYPRPTVSVGRITAASELAARIITNSCFSAQPRDGRSRYTPNKGEHGPERVSDRAIASGGIALLIDYLQTRKLL